MKIVLASNNAGKIREFNSLLQPYAFDVVAQSALGVDDVPETGLTFIENALIKARHAASITGLPVIADDSGLAVKALNGAPGIYSARYAGESKSTQDNIQKLLREMTDIPDAERHATFHCVLVYMQSATDPTPIVCEGRWHGVILHAPQGTLGFGYDPVFYLPELGKTSAELAPEVKNTLSHRGMALRSMVAALRGDE